MSEFIKEWGPVIIVAIAVIVLIAIIQSSYVQDTVATAFQNIINTFDESSTQAISDTVNAPSIN